MGITPNVGRNASQSRSNAVQKSYERTSARRLTEACHYRFISHHIILKDNVKDTLWIKDIIWVAPIPGGCILSVLTNFENTYVCTRRRNGVVSFCLNRYRDRAVVGAVDVGMDIGFFYSLKKLARDEEVV